MRALLSWMWVLVAAAGCGRQADPTRGEVQCGGQICPADTICDHALKLCLANTPPRLVIDAPSPKAVIGSPTFELRGTAEDDQGPPALEYSVGGSDFQPLEIDDRGLFSAVVGTPGRDGDPTPVTVRATDRSGLQAEAAVTVHPDLSPPRCAIQSPDAGAVIAVRHLPAVQISARVEDGSPINNADVSLDDGASWQPMTLAGGTATFDWAVDAGIALSAPKLRVRASDVAGNRCLTGPVNVEVDTDPPEHGALSLVDGEICGLPTCPVGAEASDTSSRPVELFVTLDGGAPRFVASAVDSPQGTIDVPLVDYTPVVIQGLVRDWAGNTSAPDPLNTRRTVAFDRVPPRISFSGPKTGSTLNAAAIADAGTREVTVGWAVTDADPTVALELSAARGTASSSLTPTSATSHTFTTLASDDRLQQYQTIVRATDRAGHATTESHAFFVDVVHPRFTATPALGARHVAPEVTLSFLEPTTFTNPGSALTWTLGGAPGAPEPRAGGHAWTGLSKGTGYVGTLAPEGADQAGNPIVQTQPLSFFTEAHAPDSGTILATDAGELSVAFDQDGVVTFSDIRRTNASATLRWFAVDPATGNANLLLSKSEVLMTANPPLSPGRSVQGSVNAWVAPSGSNPAGERLLAFHEEALGEQSYRRAHVRSYGGYASIVTGAVSTQLSPSGQGEQPAGAPDFAVFKDVGGQLVYSRANNDDVSTPYNSAPASFGPPMSLLYVNNASGTIQSSFYACGRSPQGFCTSGGFDVSQAADPAAEVSAALTQGEHALYLFDAAGGVDRHESCRRLRLDNAICLPAGACATSTALLPAAEQLTVVSGLKDDLVLGVRQVGGRWELVSRSIGGCGGAWSVYATLELTAGSRPHPVRFGNTLAGLYVDANRNVVVIR